MRTTAWSCSFRSTPSIDISLLGCAQNITKRELLEEGGKLRSIVAYHLADLPLAYADLGVWQPFLGGNLFLIIHGS